MSGCSREPGYCSDCDVKSDDEDEDDGCCECGAYESVKQCSECDKIFCPAHGPHYEYLDEPDVIYCVSCLESLKKRGLLSVGHECGTVICPDCKKDPDADNYNDSCMCGLDKSDEDDDEFKQPRCKKHDLYMYEDNQTKCSECCEELGEEYSGKYCGDIYGCGYTGLSEQCKLCVRCNPKLWWLERRPTKLPRKVKEFEDKNE